MYDTTQEYKKQRNNYVAFGTFGSLINPNSGKIMYDPKYEISMAKQLEPIKVYDRHSGQYINTTKFDIPNTYTLARKTQNKGKEFDLWRSASTVINHEIVYPERNNSLTRENYAKTTSNVNIENRGRYASSHTAPGLFSFDSKYGGPWVPKSN